MKNTIKIVFPLLISLLIFPPVSAKEDKYKIKDEEKLLGWSIKYKLEHLHFRRKARAIDDEFSEDAFGQLLKQLDPQKRILLQKNVDELSKKQREIDDELSLGNYYLPLRAGEIVEQNLKEIEKFTYKIIDKGFDYDAEESFEMDPDKIEFCKDMKELKDRWRLHLKYQCLGRYLSLLNQKKDREERAKKEKDELKTSGNTEKTASEKPKPLKEINPKKDSIDQVRKNLDLYFKRVKTLTRQDHFAQFFNSITNSFDPHTEYMNPESKEEFDIHMKKSLEGIGAVLRETDDGYTKVERVVPGSASDQQGDLEPEDIILQVAQGEEGGSFVDITGMRVKEVVKYIRGPKGSVVRLQIKKPDNTTKIIAITRDIVKLEGRLAKSTMMKDPISGQKYGYIYLPDFYRDFSGRTDLSATRDVRNEIIKLKEDGMQGLIFDIRDNGGGALQDAIGIAGLFIDKGPIVQVKDSMGIVQVHHDKDNQTLYDGPLVIMVNQFSASASEILAAALQDYGRAIIVGTGKTHGKGTVQQLIPLNRMTPSSYRYHDFGSLKLTIQKFYRISGSSTQNEGVMPDIILPDEKTFIKSGERFLDFALPFDTIQTVDFKRWDQPVRPEFINKLSQPRVKANDAFNLINERFNYLKASAEDTVVSLNIDDVRDEREKKKQDIEEFSKAFDNLDKLKTAPEIKGSEKDIEGLSLDDKSQVLWYQQLQKDPYIQETLRIITDMSKNGKIAKKEKK